MKRRNFILSSGSAILTGALGLSQTQRPAVGVNFELSDVPNKNPEDVDRLTVDFSKLEVTPQYLDESESMQITVSLNLDDHGKDESDPTSVSVTNGVTERLSDDVEPLVVDIVDPDITISGTVNINVDHPDIQDRYRSQFNVNTGDIPDNGVEDFETGSLDTQWTNKSYINVSTDQIISGSYSGKSDTGGSNITSPLYDWEFGGGDSYKLAMATLTYYEGAGSGMGWRFLDESGTVALGVASDNPQIYVVDSNGKSNITGNNSWDGTGEPIRVEITFDYDVEEFDVTWTNINTSDSTSVTDRPLGTSNPIQKIQGMTFDTFKKNGFPGRDSTHFIDDLEVTQL